MFRKSHRGMAIIMTVVLLVGVMPTMAFAGARVNKYSSFNTGTGYVAIGDSFTRGYGACMELVGEEERWETELYNNQLEYKNNSDTGVNEYIPDEQSGYKFVNNNCRNVKGSYPNYIADRLGLATPNNIFNKYGKMWPIAHDNVSVGYMLNLMGISSDYRDFPENDTLHGCHDSSMEERYNADLCLYGNSNSFMFANNAASYGHEIISFESDKVGKAIGIDELLSNASLITIQLGQSDVLYQTSQDLINLAGVLSDASTLPSAVSKLVQNIYERFDYFKEKFPVLVKSIRKLNPKATIVIVGTMNPMENIMLTDEVLLPIGSAANVITDSMNAFYKKCAKKYNCLYVDINNVETPSTREELSLASIVQILNSDETDKAGFNKKFNLMGHPNPEGYEQIGRMIVAAIDKDLAKKSGSHANTTPSTDVKIDIGDRYTILNWVKLDGKLLSKKNYSFDKDKHVITVKCDNKTSKLLNISIARLQTNEETDKKELKITSMSYTLKWDKKTGYSARRVYVTNDAVATAKTTINTVKSTIKSVTDTVSAAMKDLLGSFFKTE